MMKFLSFYILPVFLCNIHGGFGQTSTDCNPTNTTCPEEPALGKTISVDFTQGESSAFTLDTATEITYGEDGAEFTITKEGLAQTIVSNDYIFFGKVEITMRAANGTGIISSFVMESADLDEIDLEWLGGNSTVVETNYFGKGNTTSYNRATYVAVSDPQDTFHTYTIDWTSSSTKWYVDGELVRTLLYEDALEGANYPQTPMQIKIGNWVGGAADEATGTVQWAGGYSNMNDAPFTMYVKSITIQDYSTCASAYSYGDMTGSYESIVVHTNSSSADGNCSSLASVSNDSTASPTSTSASPSNASSTIVVSSPSSSASVPASLGSHLSNFSSSTTSSAIASSSAVSPDVSGMATSRKASTVLSLTMLLGFSVVML